MITIAAINVPLSKGSQLDFGSHVGPGGMRTAHLQFVLDEFRMFDVKLTAKQIQGEFTSNFVNYLTY